MLARVEATLATKQNGGRLKVDIWKGFDKEKSILHLDVPELDMWRGENDFMRPKWGIYRSTQYPEQLNEARAYFADICIGKQSN